VKDLKALITKSGLSFKDCPEKDDLKVRAREAIVRLKETPHEEEAKRKASSGGSSARETKTMGGYPCVVIGPQNPDMVVVILHGFGASNNDFLDIPQVMGSMLPGKTVMYVLPQAPTGPMGATQWWTIDVMKWMMAMRQGGEVVGKLIREVPPGLTECRTQMATFLEEVRATAGDIPYSKIMLSGFSQGAITAMDVALSLPADKAVAGVTVMSGAPIVVEQWAERLKEHLGIKVLVTHGQGDMVLPFVASGWLRDLLQTNGAEVQYEQHGGGHELGGPEVIKKIASHWMRCMT